MIGQNSFGRRLAALVAALRTRMPLLWLLLAAIVTVSAFGFTRLRLDDDFLRFFNSDLPAFDAYVEMVRAFEDDSADLIVLVEAEDAAAPEVVAAVSDLMLDAQFVPGIRAGVSPLSLRITAAGGAEEALFPYPPLPRAEMAARIAAAWPEDETLPRLMAEDRGAMLAILPMTEQGEKAHIERRAQIEAVEALADRAMEASGARIRLAGYPVLRDTVMRALVRDIVLLQSVGFLVGFAVAVLALRSFRLGLLTLPGPALAVFVSLGLHGLMGVAINTVTITLPVLVLVLGASDSIHISFERGRQGGRDTARATVRAIRRVAVACIFAAVTTAMAFAALATSRSEIIAELGRMGAMVTLASVATVLLTQTLVLKWAGHTRWFAPLFDRLHDRPPSGFGAARLPHAALARPRLVAWGALGVLAATLALYSQAGPRYSLMDSLYEDSPLRQTFDAIEQRVTPVSQINVVVEGTDPEVVGRVHDVVAQATGSAATQSLATVEGGAEALAAALPPVFAGRLVSHDGTQSLVSVPFRYVNGTETMALADEIEAALAADPGLAGVGVGDVTGLPVMSAEVAQVVLDDINRSLLIALFGVAVLIAVWLRNLRVAVISLVPNMLPITVIGAWVMLSGRGIEFSNGLALTVAFGIAVDDTLHALNRLRLSGGVDRIDRARLVEAFDEVAPALVTTSLVLILGVSGSIFAENKGVGDFGMIAMAVYGLALVADLFVLPAVLAAFGPKSYLRQRRPET